MNNLAPLLAILVLTDKITPQEAEILNYKLKGERVPSHWMEFVSQLEINLKRNLR